MNLVMLKKLLNNECKIILAKYILSDIFRIVEMSSNIHMYIVSKYYEAKG